MALNCSTTASFYLIDASGFIFRAFHALPPLRNPEGVPVGAVYGFINMLLRLFPKKVPERIGVVFDVARHTFRQDLYADYKANRPLPPEDLVPQFSLVREACHALGLPLLEQAGYEADDVIATYAMAASRQERDVTIVSADKDLMQLVSSRVHLWDPMKNKLIDEAAVFEKFGVKPTQVIDVQALMGDASDNVPGVPGIGIKTASALIAQFHSLENLYANLQEIPQIKRRILLEENREKAFLSRDLVRLALDAPMSCSLEDLVFKGMDPVTVTRFLTQQGFVSLSQRIKTSSFVSCVDNGNISPQPHLIQNQNELKSWIEEAQQQGYVALSFQRSDPMTSEIRGVGLALSKDHIAYLPLESSEWDEDLRALLKDPSILKIGYHLKDVGTCLAGYGLTLHPFSDVLLMSYVLHGGKHVHTLKYLVDFYLGNGGVVTESPLESAMQMSQEARHILNLWHVFSPELSKQRLSRIYEVLERPLVPVLIAMERTGICIDAQALHLISQDFSGRLSCLSQEIYGLAGQHFNIGSPKQLGDVLFESLGFSGGKKGKSGSYGTGSDILELLVQQGHIIAQKILDWRHLSKLKNTYTGTLLAQVNPKTDRIHTSFQMTTTSTGRLSSIHPNLQNIPIRTKEGRDIRRTFIPSKGNVFGSFDYSQIELRLLAHMGHVTPLIHAFQEGRDIHQETAAQVFRVSREEVDADLRRRAKMINFGIIYGISAFGLGERLGLPAEEAGRYIEVYLSHYSGIKSYMEKMKDLARQNGYVETLWGRRCYVPGIQDRNIHVRQAAERQAINGPLQGTAADFIKKAMINIHSFLEGKGWPIRLVLQIHDELLFEGPQEEMERLAPQIQAFMSQVAALQIPLVVDYGLGFNWEEAH